MGGLKRGVEGLFGGLGKVATAVNLPYQAARALGVSKDNTAMQIIDPTQSYRNQYDEKGSNANPLRQAFQFSRSGTHSLTNVLGGAVGKKSPTFTDVIDKPPVIPPKVIPLPDQDTIDEAKRRSLAAQLARSGRASTILSDSSNSDQLGP